MPELRECELDEIQRFKEMYISELTIETMKRTGYKDYPLVRIPAGTRLMLPVALRDNCPPIQVHGESHITFMQDTESKQLFCMFTFSMGTVLYYSIHDMVLGRATECLFIGSAFNDESGGGGGGNQGIDDPVSPTGLGSQVEQEQKRLRLLEKPPKSKRMSGQPSLN